MFQDKKLTRQKCKEVGNVAKDIKTYKFKLYAANGWFDKDELTPEVMDFECRGGVKTWKRI